MNSCQGLGMGLGAEVGRYGFKRATGGILLLMEEGFGPRESESQDTLPTAWI